MIMANCLFQSYKNSEDVSERRYFNSNQEFIGLINYLKNYYYYYAYCYYYYCYQCDHKYYTYEYKRIIYPLIQYILFLKKPIKLIDLEKKTFDLEKPFDLVAFIENRGHVGIEGIKEKIKENEKIAEKKIIHAKKLVAIKEQLNEYNNCYKKCIKKKKICSFFYSCTNEKKKWNHIHVIRVVKNINKIKKYKNLLHQKNYNKKKWKKKIREKDESLSVRDEQVFKNHIQMSETVGKINNTQIFYIYRICEELVLSYTIENLMNCFLNLFISNYFLKEKFCISISCFFQNLIIVGLPFSYYNFFTDKWYFEWFTGIESIKKVKSAHRKRVQRNSSLLKICLLNFFLNISRQIVIFFRKNYDYILLKEKIDNILYFLLNFFIIYSVNKLTSNRRNGKFVVVTLLHVGINGNREKRSKHYLFMIVYNTYKTNVRQLKKIKKYVFANSHCHIKKKRLNLDSFCNELFLILSSTFLNLVNGNILSFSKLPCKINFCIIYNKYFLRINNKIVVIFEVHIKKNFLYKCYYFKCIVPFLEVFQKINAISLNSKFLLHKLMKNYKSICQYCLINISSKNRNEQFPTLGNLKKSKLQNTQHNFYVIEKNEVFFFYKNCQLCYSFSFLFFNVPCSFNALEKEKHATHFFEKKKSYLKKRRSDNRKERNYTKTFCVKRECGHVFFIILPTFAINESFLFKQNSQISQNSIINLGNRKKVKTIKILIKFITDAKREAHISAVVKDEWLLNKKTKLLKTLFLFSLQMATNIYLIKKNEIQDIPFILERKKAQAYRSIALNYNSDTPFYYRAKREVKEKNANHRRKLIIVKKLNKKRNSNVTKKRYRCERTQEKESRKEVVINYKPFFNFKDICIKTSKEVFSNQHLNSFLIKRNRQCIPNKMIQQKKMGKIDDSVYAMDNKYHQECSVCLKKNKKQNKRYIKNTIQNQKRIKKIINIEDIYEQNFVKGNAFTFTPCGSGNIAARVEDDSDANTGKTGSGEKGCEQDKKETSEKGKNEEKEKKEETGEKGDKGDKKENEEGKEENNDTGEEEEEEAEEEEGEDGDEDDDDDDESGEEDDDDDDDSEESDDSDDDSEEEDEDEEEEEEEDSVENADNESSSELDEESEESNEVSDSFDDDEMEDKNEVKKDEKKETEENDQTLESKDVNYYSKKKKQYFQKKKKKFRHNYIYLNNIYKENIFINTSNVSNFITVSKDKLTATYTAWGKHTDIACVQVNKSALRDCSVYYFEVEILNSSSFSKIVVGMSSKNYTINKNPGSEYNSFGYRSDDGKKIIDGKLENYSYGYVKFDIVGCGINYYDNSVFFTKNGKLLGKACSINTKYDYFPTVGLSTLGDKIKFHLNNFCFDIYNLIYEENEKERKIIKSIYIERSMFIDLIKTHLVKCGFLKTYKAFENFLENNKITEEQENDNLKEQLENFFNVTKLGFVTLPVKPKTVKQELVGVVSATMSKESPKSELRKISEEYARFICKQITGKKKKKK